MISRTEEWLVAQTLFEGKFIARDGDTQEAIAELSFGDVSRTVTSKPWSDPTADPLADLKSGTRLVAAACGFQPDTIVFGRDAGDAFESSTKVQEAYNKLQITAGMLDPKMLEYGVVQLGSWRGLPLFVDEAEFEDVDGSMKPYVPRNCVLIACSAVPGTMAYAGVSQVNEDGTAIEVFEGRRVPLVYFDTSGEDYRRFRLSSRPCPVPQNLESWTVLEVLPES